MMTSNSLPSDAAELELRQLEDKIAAAVVSRDIGFVERVWAEDFVYTGVRGELKTKTDIIEELRTGDLMFDRLAFDDVRIRVYGETAVATGRAITKGRSSQGAISGEFRYTRVYVKRSGNWQLVTFQGTPLVRTE